MPDTDTAALRKRARRATNRIYDAAAADGEPLWKHELLDIAELVQALIDTLPKDNQP